MRFLSFEIQAEQFGIQLETIKEVIAFPTVTPTPGTPTYFLGFMRLRDQILPVIDLRIRLGYVPTLTHDTAVVVCEWNGNSVGLVVDCIHTVVAPDEKDIMKTPLSADNQGATLISCVVRSDAGLTLLLDVKGVLNASDEDLIRSKSTLNQLRHAG